MMARRYLLSGDWPIARIERDINNGRNGENVLARRDMISPVKAEGRQALTRR